MKASKICCAIFAICFLSPASAIAADSGSASLNDLEGQQYLDEMSNKIDQLKVAIDALMKKREMACMRAFGHSSFCSCLNNNMAVGLSFENYVAATIHTKDELNYSKETKENKQLIDSAISSREKCVKSEIK